MKIKNLEDVSTPSLILDKKGREMPITDLFPSNDGDKNAQKDKDKDKSKTSAA